MGCTLRCNENPKPVHSFYLQYYAMAGRFVGCCKSSRLSVMLRVAREPWLCEAGGRELSCDWRQKGGSWKCFCCNSGKASYGSFLFGNSSVVEKNLKSYISLLQMHREHPILFPSFRVTARSDGVRVFWSVTNLSTYLFPCTLPCSSQYPPLTTVPLAP